MIRRFISVVMALLIVLSMTMAVSAHSQVIDSTESVEQENYYRLTSKNLLTEKDTISDFSKLAGLPGDIKFKIPCGEDIITIGYYGRIESYDLVLQRIQEELDYLNEMYTTKSTSLEETSEILENDNIFIPLEIEDVAVDEIVFRTSEISSIELSADVVEIDVQLPSKDVLSDGSATHGEFNVESTEASVPQAEVNSTSTEFEDYHNWLCAFATSAAPHDGDGHNRFGDGYSWLPNVIQVDFKNNYSEGQNRVALYYEYFSSSSNIDNLQYDSDDGVEFEVVFYNYGGTNGSTYIEPYSMDSDVLVWTTNQPTAYLDTQFSLSLSGTDELSFCIGVEDANELDTGRFYYWTMRNTAGVNNSYTYDGAFKVCAQRTYYYADGLTAFGSLVDGAEDEVTWYRFAEEHEGTLYPKVAQTTELNWCPTRAWTYAANHTEWEYLASSDPVKTTEPNS